MVHQPSDVVTGLEVEASLLGGVESIVPTVGAE